MNLGEHEIRRDELRALRHDPTKHGVGFGVVLIARADERDSGATIDE